MPEVCSAGGRTLKIIPLTVAWLAVFYESLVVAFAFGKDVWAQLHPDAVKATADWTRNGAKTLVSSFRRKYKEHVGYEHGLFDVRGMARKKVAALKLDRVFVDLRIDWDAAADMGQQRERLPQELAGNRQIWDFLRFLGKKGGQECGLALIGAPGSGKTTLLKFIALTFAYNRQRRHRLPARVPLMLYLRQHVAVITEDTNLPLGKLAQAHFTEFVSSVMTATCCRK